MDVTLLKAPYEISFTGNIMPFIFGISPYGSNERAMNIKLNLRVMVESSLNSGIFTEVNSNSFLPNNSGIIQLDVSTVIHPYLSYLMPKFDTQTTYKSPDQSRRYKLSYYLTIDDSILIASTDTSVYTAVKGGIAMEHWHPSEFFTVNVVTNKMPLHIIAAGELFTQQLPRWLYWIYPSDDAAIQTIKIKAYYDDGSNASYTLPTTITSVKWQVCCAPMGADFVLANLSSVGKIIVKYDVTVTVPANIVIAQILNQNIDYRMFYDTNIILYRNSLGGLETIELKGEQDFEVDNTITQAIRVLPPNIYANNALMGQSMQQSGFDTAKFIGYTGLVNKAVANKMRDFFIAPEKFQMNETGKLIPIVIVGSNVKYYTNRDSVYGIMVTWNQAYQNQYYTPAVLMPITRACPGLEKMVVKQLSFNLLQISYSAPIPYNIVEFEITIGSVVNTYRFTGNTQTVTQTFPNTAVGSGTVNVQIKGRVICNPYAAVVDAGAYITIIIYAVAKTALIANNDFVTLDSGYNDYVPISTNPLTNDYDPEGLAISCIAAGGATHAGGNFTLSSGGAVTYKPPSIYYVGRDYFSYTITDGGTRTATAVYFINVGSYFAGVFAKVTFESIVTDSSGYTTGQIWVSFFSDSGCTTALDVTSLGFNVNYQQQLSTWTSHSNTAYTGVDDSSYVITNTNLTVAGVGTKVKVYDGAIFTGIDTGPDVDNPWLELYNMTSMAFVILPGTGYVGI